MFQGLVLAWLDEWQIALVLNHFDGSAHVGPEALAELLEVNITVLIDVQDILHHCPYFLGSGIDLHGFQMGLKVLVADKAVAVHVKCLEDAVSRRV